MEINTKQWQNGDKIKFSHAGATVGMMFDGLVRGYATTELVGCGRGLIIEVIDESFDMSGGSFNHVVVMESWII